MPTTAARASARQLDIITDTALAADHARPNLHSGSSSVRSGKSAAGVHSGSSSVDQRIAAIDSIRRKRNFTHAELCRNAGVELNNWHKLLRGRHVPSEATLVKLKAGLDAPRVSKPSKVIAAFHRLVMRHLALQMAFDVDVLFATDFSVQRPSSPQWLRASRIRQMAIYITAVELEVSNADLGRALGDSRANIKFARDAIEDRREDGNEIDQALTAVTVQVRAG